MSSSDWANKDYYKVLGVSKDAKPEEIKKAFRKIARDNHPDSHPGDKAAEARFKEASEAHDVLGNEKKRKEYDQQRSLFGGGGFKFPRGGGAQNVRVEDLFRNATSGEGFGDIFGNLFGSTGGRRTTTRSARRGADVEGEVTVGFRESIAGVTVPMQMVSEDACQACRGTGAKAGTMPRVCPTCEGSGMHATTSGGVFQMSEPCPDCKGRGMIVDDPCPVCNGSGRAKAARTMQVRIPAGVDDGQRIRIKGKGSPGENGGSAGDLYVVVHVKPDKVFGRDGHNLTVTVPVTFSEAALGARITVPVLSGGTVTLKVPAGTPNGRTFRVRGKGVPRSDGSRGDLLAKVEVAIPTQLDADARAALQEFTAKARQPDPRSWDSAPFGSVN
ncbi:MAG: molecular chaperone DnaJ [Acidipropionibacterium acidipropionici]|jgi:molecular chaperone DnaJ|uniref:Chaperone protein DnaJ n=2 Tax=Acidipropionibacterium acidipropionici TaxID=1748 RepID=A0A142KJJ4_9ACTN|nr:molecular chaperone DnaJ [Acidipropionibacterium acidipropionici]AFV88549.1 Chaperone protein DnaJ 2 [Acidipropionibacterium acidipropionici ATCC 4875]ALN14102.1 molecular chaperone DnaJ [Acidipropionibacterium acidipropionici]AMS06282.1 molecular chaperone DnaJ [Acidipropionibacterium acidipropionici]AOZ47737.1 molecular chaperone DnaJ [Acidipropionibacterium acidipropionici]APZ10133.1 molecular chaperone DnaJ [Acidipropionibacterium acidipropionici]